MDFKRLPPPYIPSFIVNLNRYLKELFKASDEALKINNVVQSTGDSTVNVMSQDATTTELNKKLNTAQGSENSGKYLGINEEGDAVPMPVESGGTVDSEMSDSSENAVQNKVIKAYVDNAIDVEINAALADIIGEVETNE